MDLDAACGVLERHVRGEAEKQIKAEQEKNNPKADAGPSKKGKGGGGSKYKPLSDERIDEIWVEVVSNLVEDLLVFHSNGLDARVKGEPIPRWRTEKKRTGDPLIDEGATRGARVLRDEHGRVRAVFDAAGRRVHYWKPGEA